MRYSKQHKEASRRRLVESAARAFRGRGYHATGLDEVVHDAGLTPGAFYRHFESKAALLAAALQHAAGESLQKYGSAPEHVVGEAWLRRFVYRYLALEHARDPAAGCPVASLSAELAKGGAEERRALSAAVDATVAAIAARLGGDARARARALGVLAICVGTLSLARALPDPRDAVRVLRQGRLRALS
jgi:AcrR family transcriptional regulator